VILTPTDGPQRQVIVMGPRAFKEYMALIQDKIDDLRGGIESLAEIEDRLKVAAKDPNNIKAAERLKSISEEMNRLLTTRSALKTFYVDTAKRWAKVEDRVIGHVVWAPKIDVHVPHDDHTCDFCVIHLDKKKFMDGFNGNALSLGACAAV
jgi:hypothetical protein